MSNRYPVWWDTTLTIYNKYTDPQTQIVQWYSHVVSGCFWKYLRSKVKVGNTVLESDSTVCRVPKQENFLEKQDWVQLPNDKKGNYLTFGAGDIIIKGEVDDVIDEYTKGHRSSDILDKYNALQGCIEVDSVGINVGPGRCEEHYVIRGV